MFKQLIVRIKFRSFEECGELFIVITPRSILIRNGGTCYGPSMCIEICNHFLNLKLFNYLFMQTNYWC